MNFIDVLKTIIHGIVEGITEWLPISSTGHLILLDEFLPLNVSSDFLNVFNVVIQLGAIIAVVIFFFNKLNPFAKTKSQEEKTETWVLWFKVLVGSIPVAIIGLLFDDFIESKLSSSLVVAITLVIYGVLFILIEKRKNPYITVNETKQLTYKLALIIGTMQILALIPGTSRSGITILGAMLIGCSRTVSAEFSFFLSIPAMFGASFLKLIKFGFNYQTSEIITLLIGLISSFLVSLFVIKFLMDFIKKHDFKPFGYYRIVLGIIILILYVVAVI